MATVKKSKKKLIIWIVVIALVVSGIAGGITVKAVNKGKRDVVLTTVGTSTITETVSSTGDVTSGLKREYKPSAVATVKEVFVQVGDEVKKGDKLASFDTSNLDTQVANLRNTYTQSLRAYNEAVAQQKQAKETLKSVNARIAANEKKLAKLQNQTAPTTTTKPAKTTTTTTMVSTETTTKKTFSTTTTTKQSTTHKNYPATVEGISDALSDLIVTITDLADSVEETNALVQIVMTAIAEELATGNYSPDKIADAVGDAVYEAIQKGLVDFIDSGAAVDMIEAAVKNIDWNAIGAGIATSDNFQLISVQMQLAALYAQKEIYSVVSQGQTVNAQKAVVDSAKGALDAMVDAQAELSAGWTADFNGTITTCDIVTGGTTTALSTAITLENMDSRVVTISLGEYDLHKVKVGMEAVVKTAYGEYTGKVEFIAPTATGGSSSSIMDNVGSMAGISGLSSLTNSGAGVECRILVDHPDENIIIGFDADVTITTGTYENVPSVPIESIVLEKTGTYVYVYNEDEGTATKTQIQTGATSDTSYEVKSGLFVGQKIVAIPASDYKEDTFKVNVKENSKTIAETK